MRRGTSLKLLTSNPRGALAAVVAFGLICRLSQYAANTSLWHDEAFVALNVLHKSYAQLLGPLDWQEAAPPGFLILEKVMVERFGRSEYVLRFIPLVAGLLGMGAFAALSRAVSMTRAGALWAVLLMAGSDKLIAQANEAKHFTFDLLWATLLMQVAVRCWRAPSAVVLLGWGLLGAVGLWVSFASAFVFAATSLVLAARARRDRRVPERIAYLAANFLVLVSFAGLLPSIRAQLSGGLLEFWTNSFPDTGSTLALPYWLARSLLGFLNYFWQPLGAGLMLLALLGGARWWRTRRLELIALCLPVGLALIAACLRRWPFGGNQHMVFAAPMVFLLVGEGMEVLRQRLTTWHRWVGWTCVALLFLPGVGSAIYRVGVPRQRHEVRPVMEFVQRYMEERDRLLVFCPAEAEFYTGRDFRQGAVQADAASRVWFIGTRSGMRPFPAEDVLVRLRNERPLLQSIEAYGAAAYLFGPARSAP